MEKLDQTDRKLLQLLQENARLTIKELAAQLHLTTTPVFERIKRLEKNGVIDKYIVLLNREKIGKNMTIFLQVSLQEHQRGALDEFVDQVIQFEEVMECYHISGDSDFMLKIITENMETYNEFVLKKLSLIPHIGKVRSQFALSCRKFTTAVEV